MIGYAIPLRALVIAIRLQHHVRGPKGDYLGLGLAAVASWAGVPGPGEAALITGGILAAHHHLDIASVVVVAWIGGIVGGTMGWVIGLKAGREVLSSPGPVHRARKAALARGDRFYERYGPVAVFFTPSWIAGIYGMRPVRFLVANALAALVWALLYGLGAFFIGPSIADLVTDLGLVGGIILGALVVATVLGVLRQRSRRRSRQGG